MASSITAVIIGRNEGERFRRCVRSLAPSGVRIIYVDSGSTDGSVEFAREAGLEVVSLDLSSPFTMARGRNAGLRRALELRPDLEFVQFIDGDCELVSGWLKAAEDALRARPEAGVAFGRRRERFPDLTVYNLLADMEWDGRPGLVEACGGDSMMRVAALRQGGFFNEGMIAGEEPELCVRLRATGWKILRLAEEMTIHDIAMERFSQWWLRCLRGGYAAAEGRSLHGAPPERHRVRECRSAWVWGALMPALTAGAAAWRLPGAIFLAAAFPVQALRIALGRRKAGDGWRRAGVYAAFCMLQKFPEIIGQMRFHRLRRAGIRPSVIEYKDGPSEARAD